MIRDVRNGHASSVIVALGCSLAFVVRATAQDPPDELPSGRFILQGGPAARGGSLRVPLKINASGVTFGFSISLDFDEEVLEATGIEEVFHHPTRLAWDYQKAYFDNHNATPGNHGIDEGFLTCTGLFDLWKPVGLEPAMDVEVVALHFNVRADAPLGPTELRLHDGGASDDTGSFTVVNCITTSSGLHHDPPADITPIVVTEATAFLRGEINADGKLDLSDAVFLLRYLFLGGPAPRCLDAADTNDSGSLDLSDAVYLLGHLYLGTPAPPPPYPGAGEDPTADQIHC